MSELPTTSRERAAGSAEERHLETLRAANQRAYDDLVMRINRSRGRALMYGATGDETSLRIERHVQNGLLDEIVPLYRLLKGPK